MHTPQTFFIVGAQKSGTTSLHRYLSAHPDIYMPIEKEVPFFDRESISEEDWKEYRSKYLDPKPGVLAVGTSTPQYMCDIGIARKIFQFVPDAKIVMLLRDPIARAVSQYKMAVRRGWDTRDFGCAIREQLQEHMLLSERGKKYSEILSGGEHQSYVVRGEYKRIIDEYRVHFPSSIKVVCTECLESRRQELVTEVLKFLNVRESIVPGTISRIYHQSSGGPHWLTKWLKNRLAARWLARQILPAETRLKIQARFLSYEDGDSDKIRVSNADYLLLKSHYQITNAGLSNCATMWFKHRPDEAGDYYF